jgi:hypothetical protein
LLLRAGSAKNVFSCVSKTLLVGRATGQGNSVTRRICIDLPSLLAKLGIFNPSFHIFLIPNVDFPISERQRQSPVMNHPPNRRLTFVE